MTAIVELIEKYWLVSVLCSAICLSFTLLGGFILVKGLETLKDDAD